jgi:hypothetical protein
MMTAGEPERLGVSMRLEDSDELGDELAEILAVIHN